MKEVKELAEMSAKKMIMSLIDQYKTAENIFNNVLDHELAEIYYDEMQIIKRKIDYYTKAARQEGETAEYACEQVC